MHEEAFGCLGRDIVAEARREGGLRKVSYALECKEPVRGGRRGL